MEIVVKAHHADLPERFKAHAVEKLERLDRLDNRIMRLDVEVSEERNPRQSDFKERVELTCRSKGPVIRAEAAAADLYAALDIAIGKLQSRLRRAADKRRIHHGNGAHAPATLRSAQPVETLPSQREEPFADDDAPLGRVVREKVVPVQPMTTEEAVLQMELVGHDFFLYADQSSGAPSVVYRRKGYDYGVIRLEG
jgi:ribosomal subunit interface protein